MKRSLIIVIVILIIVAAAIFGYMYFGVSMPGSVAPQQMNRVQILNSLSAASSTTSTISTTTASSLTPPAKQPVSPAEQKALDSLTAPSK